MDMKMKTIKFEIGLVTVESGVALEIDIEGDIYRKKDASVTVMDVKKESSSETVTKKDPYMRRPKNAIKYETTYGVWITPEYVLQVKQAILQLDPGLKKSFNEIRAKTGLSTNKCRATLKHMKDTDDAISKKTQSEGVTYCLMKDEKIIEEEPIKIEEMEIKQRINKGKKIDTYQGNAIYENVLNEINFLILQGKGDTANLRKIIKKYNSDYKASTVYQRAHQYRKYAIEKQQNMMVKDKGRKLAELGGNTIYENVYNDIQEAQGETKEYIYNIISSYYPNSNKVSYPIYHNAYKRYIAKENEEKTEQNLDINSTSKKDEKLGYDKEAENTEKTTTLHKEEKFGEKTLVDKKSSKDDKTFYNSTYNTKLTPVDINQVLQSIKNGNDSTNKIVGDTKQCTNRVRSALQWLKDKGIVGLGTPKSLGSTTYIVLDMDWKAECGMDHIQKSDSPIKKSEYYIDTYNINLRPNEINQIVTALEFGHNTTREIARTTCITIPRIQATLIFLKKEKVIKRGDGSHDDTCYEVLRKGVIYE